MKDDSHLISKREQFVNAKKSNRSIHIYAGVAIVLVVAAIVVYLGASNSAKTAQIDPREAKYIGRFLPQGYEPAKLTEPIKYDTGIEMTTIKPEIKGGKILINVGDVISKRLVYFEYKRPGDGQVISMMAYIKPSGKLFTGVSMCPPCQSKYHYFDVDGALTCKSCDTKRDPETQAGISGACRLYPADEIAHKLVGDKIEIAESDMAKWAPQPIDRPVGE